MKDSIELLARFARWEGLVIKVALSLGVVFALTGVVLGPAASALTGISGFDFFTSLSLGAKGALGVFLVGTLINLGAALINFVLLKMNGDHR